MLHKMVSVEANSPRFKVGLLALLPDRCTKITLHVGADPLNGARKADVKPHCQWVKLEGETLLSHWPKYLQ